MVHHVMGILRKERTISSGRLDLMEKTASELLLEGWGFGEETFTLGAHVESTC